MCHRDAFANRYLEVLNDRLGWEASTDEDGDVVFPLSDLPAVGRSAAWIVNQAPHDPGYLRMHTGLRLAPGGDRPESLAQLATDLTRGLKVIKLAVDDDFLISSAELLVAGSGCLPDRDHLAAILPRVRRMLVGAVVKFHESAILRGIKAATLAVEE